MQPIISRTAKIRFPGIGMNLFLLSRMKKTGWCHNWQKCES